MTTFQTQFFSFNHQISYQQRMICVSICLDTSSVIDCCMTLMLHTYYNYIFTRYAASKPLIIMLFISSCCRHRVVKLVQHDAALTLFLFYKRTNTSYRL